MFRWSVAKWKCYNMVFFRSFDNIVMFIIIVIVIVINICYLFKDISSGWKIKVIRNSYNFGFFFYFIWKCDFNFCYIKVYNNFEYIV